MSEFRLLNYRQSADYLGLSERTMWSLGKNSIIPKVQIGVTVRFDVRDLDAFIEKQKQAPANNPES